MMTSPDAGGAMTAGWDVDIDTGALVSGSAVLAEALGMDARKAAGSMLADPVLLDSAPARVQQERDASAHKATDGH